MKRTFAVLFVLGIIASPVPALAQTSFATQVGTKLLTSVLGALIGKGFSSIFGTGPKPVTAEELGRALDKSFNSEKLKDIHADIVNLRSKVRAYQKTASIDSRRNQIDVITDLADHVRSTVQVRIQSDGLFFDLLPDYMTATNVWLAFKAERKYVSTDADATEPQKTAAYMEANHIVAGEVVHALTKLHEFYYSDFIDTGERKCIVKRADQLFSNIHGEEVPNKFAKLDFSRKLCKKDRDAIEALAAYPLSSLRRKVPSPAWFSSYRVIAKNAHAWFYTYETSIGRKRGGEYTLDGPYTTKAKAEKARVAKAIVFYGDIVGDIPGMVRNWEKLAAGVGTSHDKSEATRLTKELGAR